MDTEAPANPPNTQNGRTTRRRTRTGMSFVATVILVAVVLLIQRYRSSNLEWYVTSPIDSRGRRLHILVPSGWRSVWDSGSQHGEWERDDSPDGGRGMTIMPPATPPKTNVIRAWLARLGLISADQPTGVISLNVGREASNGSDDTPERDMADGKVHVHSMDTLFGQSNWAARGVPIRNTDKHAFVMYMVDKRGDERSEMANAICNSMYVE